MKILLNDSFFSATDPILICFSIISNSTDFTFPHSVTPISPADFLVRLMEHLGSASMDQAQEDQEPVQEKDETKRTEDADSSDESF